MSKSRPLLLLTLLASSTALSGLAHAATPDEASFPEVGSWGQAWGEDAAPVTAPPPRRASNAAPAPGYVPPPAAKSLPTDVAPVRQTQPSAPSRAIAAAPLDEYGQSSFPESGSWGQAWGEDEVPAPIRPRSSQIPSPSQPALAPPPAGPRPDAAAAQPRTQVAAVQPPPMIRLERSDAEGSSDAVGLKHPPRIIPRALAKASRKDEGDNPPVHMVADQVIYDREYSIVTAKGRVEMMQSGRTLTADTVTYNLKQDVMGASGNVVSTEPSGEVTFADYFELTGDFKNGVARDMRMILADNSRLAAQAAQRIGGDRTDFDRAVYTACEPCADDPKRTPLWQVKAERVTHNQAEAQIEYRDAWLEVAGIPVAYTPYLSHPDPTVKRKSGFLSPVLGYGSSLGASVTTPYFFVLSDSEDVTLAPRFMFPQTGASTIDDVSKNPLRRVQFSGEHRWRGVYGESKTQASITADRSTGVTRGNIESKGLVDMDTTWRAGWQVQYQSDLDYRSTYHVRTENDRPWLLTRPYIEGFGRRNYAMVETMSFQGQQVVEDQSKRPMVLPHMVSQMYSQPGWAGSYWTLDSDAMSFMRTKGTEGQRMSQRTAWNLPIVSPDGQVMTLTSSLRGDAYHATNLAGVSNGEATTGRAIPEVSMLWRYPFASQGQRISQVVEPIAMIASGPVGGNSLKIPNEDGLDFELDETNVLRPNRLSGLDRVEGGTRGGYGLRWSAYPDIGGMIGAQVAQGWRLHTDSTFAPGSGFTENFSDYLGRVDIAPTSYLRLTDRLRLDRKTLDARRNEATISIGPRPLSFATSYGYNSAASSAYPRRHYINYSVASELSEYWRFTYSLNQDLTANGGTVNWQASGGYNDECFALLGTFSRNNSTNSAVLSGYTAMVSVVLKSLGEAPVSLF